MTTIFTNTLKAFALGIIAAASIHSAQAAAAHTYVSGTGTDTSNTVCSRTTPCATFANALTNTTAGGVITALDAGDYGSVTISKAVTIDGTGTQASIVVNSSTDAITINGATNDTIILRHLTLTNLSGTYSGVMLNAGNLVMDECKISGFGSDGIRINGSSSGVVENTTITGCGEGVITLGTGLVTLRTVILQGNHFGLDTEGGAVDISHSLITQNSGDGVYCFYSGSTLSVSNCMISGNGTAVSAQNDGFIRLTNNDIFNNTTGIDTTGFGGGIVSSTGNNRKAGNSTSGAPTPGKVIVQQ